jgi:hypothetical protein
MLAFDDIKLGSCLCDLDADETAEVIQIAHFGTQAFNLGFWSTAACLSVPSIAAKKSLRLGVADRSTPYLSLSGIAAISGVGDRAKASSFVYAADHDRDENQPPPKHFAHGDNFLIVPITPINRPGHDHDNP